MTERRLNRLTEALRELCAAHVREEKWVLAPSLRIGYQWLDAVTRSGQPVLNARVKTLASLALDLAAPAVERGGTGFATAVREEVILDGILSRRRGEGGYLSRLEHTPSLLRAVASTLRDLRLAGISPAALEGSRFEVPAKGREISDLLSAFEDALRSRGLADRAGVLRLALERLGSDPSALPQGLVAAMPDDMEGELRGLERALWEGIPAGARILLPADRPGQEGTAPTDAALLAWASRPGEAPPPQRDGTAFIYRAVGEANEVREVFRRCLGGEIPLDEVEVLHTDASTYVPLVFELASLLAPEPGGPIPATFAEGIPVRYSRPGRALAAWLSWMVEDYPQSTLTHMVQDGLLDLGPLSEGKSHSRLGAVLRALPIGKGRGRYLAAIDEELAALEWRKAHPARSEDGEGEGPTSLERRIGYLDCLREAVSGMLSRIPDTPRDRSGLLNAAESFLLERARGLNEMDEYCRQRLLDGIRELRSCLTEEDPPALDVRGWLVDLVRSARVEGKGPRPGCLYVAPLASGGHSGRSHTFIVGMDDGRFPGAGLQDPLLLDGERAAISDELPTAAGRLAASLEDFSRLAARIRGTVTMGYSCRDLADDRDAFPSPALLAAYRILSGDREGVQDDLLAWLPDPASFAPREPGQCLDTAEWWLWRLCGDPAVEDPEGAVARAFPHLGRGLAARRARESDLFTAYDGCVPEAAADHDPARPGGPVLSASRLETLGRCPLEYFFRYVLGIKPPQEHLHDPSRWLEPAERGSLLHAVFKAFHVRLRDEGRLPVLEEDRGMLQEILEREMGAWARRKPPPNREAYEREAEDLRRTARIFLQEEEEHCRGRRPLHFEVAVGPGAHGEGDPMDSPEPVEIALPDGRTIRTRGVIDRIDEVGEPGSLRFTVCDYKTGRNYDYDRKDPFRQGRCMQNLIYTLQAESLLSASYPGAAVESFQYFFPSAREHGERIEWSAGALAGGMDILNTLCDLLARGCFPFTDNESDVRMSDYRAAFGDAGGAAAAMRAKLSNPANASLAPFRKLRGHEEDEGG